MHNNASEYLYAIKNSPKGGQDRCFIHKSSSLELRVKTCKGEDMHIKWLSHPFSKFLIVCSTHSAISIVFNDKVPLKQHILGPSKYIRVCTSCTMTYCCVSYYMEEIFVTCVIYVCTTVCICMHVTGFLIKFEETSH